MRLRVIVVFSLVKAEERAVNEEAPAHCSFALWQQEVAERERTLSGVGLSMEGTSGAAECALLRGRAHEAALGSTLRLSPAFFAMEADRGARKCVEGGRRKRRSAKQAVGRSLARFRVSVA